MHAFRLSNCIPLQLLLLEIIPFEPLNTAKVECVAESLVATASDLPTVCDDGGGDNEADTDTAAAKLNRIDYKRKCIAIESANMSVLSDLISDDEDGMYDV